MKRMLVVEDDLQFQKVLRRIFKSDFELCFCESADDYYENCSSEKYTIIIIDISLKGKKSGLELIKEIKAAPSYTGTPIICLTAHAQTKMRKTAIESGSDYFLTKPVTSQVLKDAVKRLIEKR